MRENPDANKDPAQLEREVQQQRRELNDTMRALEDRFSSREIYNQASNYLRDHGREYAESFSNSIKANPLPVALTAIGLMWMMMGQRQPSSPSYRTRPSGTRSPGTGKLKQAGSQLRERASSATDEAARTAQNLRERASDAGHALSEKVSGGISGMREGMSHSRERMGHAREQAGHARERMGHALRGGRSNMEQLLHDQPMAVGAIGIALGAILGAAMPRTRAEDRMLGHIGDEARSKAAELAEQGYQKASEMGQSLSQQAKQAVSSQSSSSSEQQSKSQASPQQSSQQPSPQKQGHAAKTSPASRGPSATPYP